MSINLNNLIKFLRQESRKPIVDMRKRPKLRTETNKRYTKKPRTLPPVCRSRSVMKVVTYYVLEFESPYTNRTIMGRLNHKAPFKEIIRTTKLGKNKMDTEVAQNIKVVSVFRWSPLIRLQWKASVQRDK
jgi:hypothetical protein